MNNQKLIKLRCKAWGITEDEYYCNRCSDFSLEDMARAYRRGKNKGRTDATKENAELKSRLNKYKHDCSSCLAFGKHCPHKVNGDPYFYDCYLTVKTLEKENAELEEQISVLLSCKDCPENKGGYICEKEYNDKCLTQKIQFIKELQEENAGLKRGYQYEAEIINGKPTGKAILVPDSLAYAKSIIQDLLNNSDEYAKQRAREFLEDK